MNDPALFDAWLVQEMERPLRRSLKLQLIERPENIPSLPPDTRFISDDDETVY